MKRLIYITLLVLTGCELIVDIDMPRDPDKMVTTVFAKPDSTWKVDLTASRYILEDLPFAPIVNAQISIADSDGSNIVLTQDPKMPGTYRANSRPVPGHHYKMTASAFGYPSIEAEMTMPNPVKLTRVFFDSAAARIDVYPNGSSSAMPLEISFEDPAEVDNYYDAILFVFYTIKVKMPNGQIEERPSVYRQRFTQPEQRNDLIDADYRPLLTDKTFAGSTHTLRTMISLNQSDNNRLDRIEIRLVNVGEEYYKYQETKQLQERSSGDPFAQPVQVFSNITNGFGVFAGSSYDVKAWDY